MKSKTVPTWKTLDDLKGLSFGATLGYTYTKPFWDAAKDGRIQVQETRSDEINFRKLLAGRIDVFPMEEITGWQLVKKKYPLGEDILTTDPNPLSSSSGHLIFKKSLPDSEALVKTFNEGLKALKNSGEYDHFVEEFYKGIY
ncbi:MAG: transporter substrate-binding domain-containing protein [Hahellaceae bacterium]|nr:transporter substrate-binding domain-containing protein [Hahellaceae bacterium]